MTVAYWGVEMSTDEQVDDAALGACDQQRISDAVVAIAESRALIDQTKGMLMFVYGIDADAAFDLLRLQSQHHNVKLRLVAEQIWVDVVELSQSKGPARRLGCDGLLLTAHQRITDVTARQRDGQSKTDD